MYCYSHPVERVFNKLKYFRAISTPYWKYDTNYLAFIEATSFRI